MPFLICGARLDPGAMRKLSKLEHKEKKQMTIWSNHTKLHLFKRKKKKNFITVIISSGCDVTPRPRWFISGWKMLMRHLLPADCVEIPWTSFFLLSAARKEAAAQ